MTKCNKFCKNNEQKECRFFNTLLCHYWEFCDGYFLKYIFLSSLCIYISIIPVHLRLNCCHLCCASANLISDTFSGNLCVNVKEIGNYSKQNLTKSDESQLTKVSTQFRNVCQLNWKVWAHEKQLMHEKKHTHHQWQQQNKMP